MTCFKAWAWLADLASAFRISIVMDVFYMRQGTSMACRFDIGTQHSHRFEYYDVLEGMGPAGRIGRCFEPFLLKHEVGTPQARRTLKTRGFLAVDESSFQAPLSWIGCFSLSVGFSAYPPGWKQPGVKQQPEKGPSCYMCLLISMFWPFPGLIVPTMKSASNNHTDSPDFEFR
jgi:hypothetical protein